MTKRQETVVIRRYTFELEAELARAILGASGVDAIVLRDNAGGMLPSMGLLSEVRLAVLAEDETRARIILDEEESPSS